jgi:hypothetical protein
MTASMLRDSLEPWSVTDESLRLGESDFYSLNNAHVSYRIKGASFYNTTLTYTYQLPDDLVDKIEQASTVGFQIITGGPGGGRHPSDSAEKLLETWTFDRAQQPGDAPLAISIAVSQSERTRITGYLENCRH